MSKPIDEENPSLFPLEDTTEAAAPARKRAVKKTAAKKVAVKNVAAKKTTVKKAATKKTAAKKSAVRKTAAKAEPAAEAPAEPVMKVAAEPVVATIVEKTVQVPKEFSEDSASETKRFGRVPGGGPVVQRESQPPQPPPYSEGQKASAGEPVSQQPHSGGQRDHPHGQDAQTRESRSKRRREKRKKRMQERKSEQQSGQQPSRHSSPRHEAVGDAQQAERPQALSGPKIETDGMLELAPKGFGFLRVPSKNFEQARDDIFITPETIRKYHLRVGQWIHGLYQIGQRGPQLVEVTAINGMPPAEASKLPHFDELKAINPNKRISFETTPERFTTRVVDIMAPVGRGQRGLIVSPPRSGKTTLLLHMAEAIREKYEDTIHLMVLLVDERPEEVTEFRRALPGAEIYASSNDEQPRNHCRIAELAIERAKRLVEAGKDVFLLMDSITRLARAYNNTMNNRGRGTGSGGITIGALEVPRRLFAAARNTRGAGSLTILATALIQTNSRADEAIFMEFKGTGNMELVLDRKIAENYIYPAVDIFKSGTRREELLLAGHMLHKIHLIRRGLSGHRPVEAMERLLFFLKKFSNNPQMLLEIKG
jgi:transcription termination factor Rho